MHHIYIHLYVKLLNDINNQNDIRILLNRELNSSYKKLIENNITGNTYEDLCNKNNKLDKLSGLSILISNLEKNISIENNTDVITHDLLENLNYNDLDYIYKTLICIQKCLV